MASEYRELLLDSVSRMLEDACTPRVVAAAEREWPRELWDLLEAAGLPLAAVPAAAGGSDASLGDSLAIARLAAYHAAPVPLLETALAGLLLAEHGLAVPAGPLAAAWGGDLRCRRRGGGWELNGTANRVPWGASLTALAVVAGDGDGGAVLLCADPADARTQAGRNLASEPRDELRFERVAVAAGTELEPARLSELELQMALGRAVQIAGAGAAGRDLAVRFATERIQFGRPISRFQAVQQLLAELAGEVAVAEAACDGAGARVEAEGWEDGAGAVAAAKACASQAAGRIARLSHQVHGAIGFTEEHRLQHLTRRLWSWREEAGNEDLWAGRLGERLLNHSGPPWELIAQLSGAERSS